MCGGRIAAQFHRPEFSEAALLAAALPDQTTPRFAEPHTAGSHFAEKT
jgi:L-arabinose transport system ATP-binding protein